MIVHIELIKAKDNNAKALVTLRLGVTLKITIAARASPAGAQYRLKHIIICKTFLVLREN